MAGVFQELVEVVNRTSEQLEIVFDGQRIFVEPNYDADGNRLEDVRNMVPVIVIPYALNQNVIMGSEDAIDPSDFRSKIGVVFNKKKDRKEHTWHDCSFVKPDPSKLTRVPLEDVLDDPTAKIVIRGKVAPKAVDAGLPGVTTPFDMGKQ